MPSSSLQLLIVASHGNALPNETGARFDAAGGSIGRAADNTLVLPDDDDGDGATVARRHALIRAHGDEWLLLNTSEHAALAVNGRLVAPRAQTALQVGDIVNIGAYVLRVATSAALPSWNLPGGASQISPHPAAAGFAYDAANPLHRSAPPRDFTDDRPLGLGPAASLHDLLDTPLDPLALFGAPTQAWSGSQWHDTPWREANVPDLFADLVATPAEAFDAPRMNSAPGHAIRDNVPEFDGHLRLKIATAVDEPKSDKPGTRRNDYGDAFARLYDASVCSVRVSVPNYEHGHGHGHGHGSSSGDRPHKPNTPSRDESIVPSELAALAHAFLEGAAIAPHATAEAGLTPEFMHTLGALVRALKQSTSQN